MLDRVGAGGMGVVYTAFDPELERTIAIKLLNRTRAQLDTSRLQREAQAMARISHPNVLAIHDVGLVDGQVFIAMEFVDGQTLGEWFESGPGWREVAEVFIGAGRGLAAAHAAELIHRDFKPDNVLVDKEGRARVLDFGLARAEGIPETEPSDLVTNGDIITTGVSDRLTQTGAIMGTPAYMAPEQHVGIDVDARADQFSFCVALFEGLYGTRPFRGDSVHVLGLAKSEGRIVTPQASNDVPAWLHEVVTRGLQPNPADRWPSMRALIRALEEGLSPKTVRRPWLAALAIAGAAGAVTIGFAMREPQQPPGPCADADAQLGVWGEAERDAVRTAFETAGFSPQSIEATQGLIDGYAEQWTEMRVENCRATFVDRAQSGAMMDLRTACLDRRKTEFHATIDLLASGAPAALAEGAKAVEQLTPVEVCADTKQLGQRQPPPEDPELRQRVEDTEAGLAAAQATFAAGLYGEMPSLLEALPAVGHAPVDAQVERLRGRTQVARGGYEQAIPTLEAARILAARAGDDRLVAEVDLDLAHVLGVEMAQTEAGLTLVSRAKADLARIGDDVVLERRQRSTRARVIRTAGKVSEAFEIYTALLEELEAAGEEQSFEAYEMRRALAGLDATLGHHEQAVATLEQLIEDLESRFGPDHPTLAYPLTNLGGAYAMSGQFDRALPPIQRLVRISDDKLGPQHPDTGTAHEALGVFYFQLGRTDEALAEYELALGIYDTVYEPTHPALLRARGNVGDALIERGELDEAEAVYAQARDDLMARYGDEHDYLTFLNFGLAEVHLLRGEYREALEDAEAGRTAGVKTLGETNIRVAESWTLEAQAQLGLGEHEAAWAAIEQSRAMMEMLDPAPATVAQAERIASAIALARGDRRQANALLRSAHARALEAGEAGDAERATIEKAAAERSLDLTG